MAHDIFPFVNVFVVTNILTRNYHEFLYFFSLSQYIIRSMIVNKQIYRHNLVKNNFNFHEFLDFRYLKKKIVLARSSRFIGNE